MLGLPTDDIDISTDARPERVMQIAEANGLQELGINLRLNLADELRFAGRYGEAEDEYARVAEVLTEASSLDDRILLAAVQLAKQHEDSAYQFDTLLNIGYLYMRLGAFDRALASG